MSDFNTIWNSITECEGQTFATSGGQPFAFDVTDDGLAVRRSDLFLSKEDIQTSYKVGGSIKNKQLSAYIAAVLGDVRIRGRA